MAKSGLWLPEEEGHTPTQDTSPTQDAPEFDVTSLPLPIIHRDFSFTAKDIAEAKLTEEQVRDILMRKAALRASRDE